jgi:hypothetical protein
MRRSKTRADIFVPVLIVLTFLACVFTRFTYFSASGGIFKIPSSPSAESVQASGADYSAPVCPTSDGKSQNTSSPNAENEAADTDYPKSALQADGTYEVIFSFGGRNEDIIYATWSGTDEYYELFVDGIIVTKTATSPANITAVVSETGLHLIEIYRADGTLAASGFYGGTDPEEPGNGDGGTDPEEPGNGDGGKKPEMPSALVYADGVLTWDPSEGAAFYVVTANGVKVAVTDECRAEVVLIEGYNFAAGGYNFKIEVAAVSASGATSGAGMLLLSLPLPVPQNIIILTLAGRTYISFEYDLRATGFELLLDGVPAGYFEGNFADITDCLHGNENVVITIEKHV